MIRLFKHYVPYPVLLLGLFDFVLLMLAAQAGWALRLWQMSGLDEEAFVAALYDAKLSVRKAQAHGVGNKGAYWFKVLRDQLDLN